MGVQRLDPRYSGRLEAFRLSRQQEHIGPVNTTPVTHDVIASARTLPQFVRAIAATYGDDMAIRLHGDTIPDDSLTFADLDRRSAQLARGLIASGVGKGTRVGFIAGNGPLHALWLFAIARAGGVAVPVSTLLKGNELVRVIRQSDIAILLSQRNLLGHDYVDRLCEALPGLRDSQGELRLAAVPFLRKVFAGGDDLPRGVRPMEELDEAAATVPPEILEEIEREIYPSDQAIEIYTSGSMALPKGVRHDHGPVLFRTHYLARMTEPKRGEERLAVLPMFWVGGLMISLMPSLAAGSITVCTEGTPTSSRHAMGSVLAPEDLKIMESLRPFWALGMSETLGPYSYGDEFRVEGRPVCAPLDNIADGYEVRVADEHGNPVADGGTGEIQVRGYPLSRGLHKLERSDYYTPDGFYHTGDMGLVEGTRIHFVGRGGDMIKSAGSNVSPAEVEMEMQGIAGVHSAYVVGLPDAERGQLVVAAVVPRDGATLDFEAIRKQLRAQLSPFKVPREYIAITREEVPMLPSNKVHRRAIETMLAERLGRS